MGKRGLLSKIPGDHITTSSVVNRTGVNSSRNGSEAVASNDANMLFSLSVLACSIDSISCLLFAIAASHFFFLCSLAAESKVQAAAKMEE